MKVYLASDHGGFEIKEKLKAWLEENNYSTEDLGAFSFDPGDDYPDFVLPLAQKIASESESFGIILGRSGNGEAIAANKLKGVRAAVCLNQKMAQMAREHNDARIISIGADYVGFEEIIKMVQAFLSTPFTQEERHVRRLQKIDDFLKVNG